MVKDTKVSSAQPCSGAKTVLFGIDCIKSISTDLGLELGVTVQSDSRMFGAGSLAQAQWSVAICTLFSTSAAPHHDAISVIEALVGAGFMGQLLVLAPPLLRPQMVETELKTLAPGMTVRLIAGALPPLVVI